MTARKLPPTAYSLREGQTFVPLTAGESLPEFTFKAVLTGIVLGIVFGAANTYLGLVSGLTISTSIPVAVLTVVVFRVLRASGNEGSILEVNLSQTVGSASSSVASGVLFTMPALFLWGAEPAWLQMTLLAMCGGLIGVLCMVPLRKYLIQREHGKLPYPEGMACAEVLVASESGGQQARAVFSGIGVGMAFQLLTDGFKLLPSKFSLALPGKAALSASVSPALIGVGYILGVRVASVMVAGGALSALVIIPAIAAWGADRATPFYPETEVLIRDMSASDLWNRYVRYIGAGAVAAAGIWTLVRSIPTMLESFRLGLAQMRTGAQNVERTDRDLSLKTVGLCVGAIVLVLTFVPGILGYLDSFAARGAAALLIAIFAFFFVTVSSRIVGLVGVTSNPTSGMTIATLLGTSAIFAALGWTDLPGKATALMVGTAVCIAASIAGDTSQDLKTGFVLGATPVRQQIGELVGVITSAGVVCAVMLLLDSGVEGGIGGEKLAAPQGTLMRLVIDGVIDKNLPWALIGIGAALALAAVALRLPALAFAVGIYLPLYTMAAVFVGGLVRWFVERSGANDEEKEVRRSNGILFGSGLVGGGGLTGVVLALWVVLEGDRGITGFKPDLPHWGENVLAIAAIGAIVWFLRAAALRRDVEAPSR
jgi:putative OPT family oligopeptide transporter